MWLAGFQVMVTLKGSIAGLGRCSMDPTVWAVMVIFLVLVALRPSHSADR